MYEHTQVGRTILFALGATALATAGVLLLVRDPAAWIICGVVLLVLVLTAVICSSLTVTVNERELIVRFGPGPIRRRIARAEIAEAQAVRNPWWYGYGIHLTPTGWLWNVSGPDAVELVLRDGRRFRIGTDDPQGLAAVLARAPRG